jgi:hypothetical protein
MSSKRSQNNSSDPGLGLDPHYIAYLMRNWPSQAFALVAQAEAAAKSRRESVNEA